MLPSAEQVKVVHEKLTKYKVKNLVVDPVMVATSGSSLMKDSTAEVMARLLFPISRVITPNIPEAQALTGLKITSRKDMEKAAEELGNESGCAVLLKGGHSIEDASDVLYENGKLTWFEGKRIESSNTHGTGCTLSSAIASNLALGLSLEDSIRNAKAYISDAIASGLNLGKGSGPLDHMVNL